MQFYLDGYRPGDPLVEQPHPSVAERPEGLPEEVDVLIVGCGPAGLVLAAQLANFPDIRTAVVDRRDGPLEVGQADGVACRTVEMFEALVWPTDWSPRPTGSTRSLSGARTRRTAPGSRGPGASRTPRRACRSSRT
jgi:choline dehydrogenase-like flavoprotein